MCIALCGFDHVKNTAVFAAFDAADGEILSVFACLKFAVIGRDRLLANNRGTWFACETSRNLAIA